MVNRRGKSCIGVSLLLVMVIAIVIVALFLTILKPREPVISVHPVGLEGFKLSLNFSSNVTLGMLITVGNPNYASFEYKNSITYVSFRDTVVADVPIQGEFVPARGAINVTTSADLMVGKLILDPKFWSDILGGYLNLTSTATLPGVAHVLNFIKLKATAYSSCTISLEIRTKNISSNCISKIKL
ncbi:hypothetical protein VNO77_28630 [Canavalia gladiata]|uniref:Late embryogenesis abundant protein LEA-2 subgroup domain-containing protein n=1 Tax=Canavalia gladiata TaxID=3824 RepID=A0AAN9Q7A2_CANGL